MLSLADWCRGQKAIMDIANGLFSLHSKGIMHLDLKPANILLADDGKAKISDLGTSSPIPHESSFRIMF